MNFRQCLEVKMLNFQKEFIAFHNAIKLDDENEELVQKREILLKKLKDNISDDAVSFEHFNQGSYAMGTGIKPKDGDYDIDVGLKFNLNKDDYDPITVKKWVRDALRGHTKSVEIRRSCVTVTYQQQGEALYHVDFAVYAANNSDNELYIAKGKENSNDENRFWEISCPIELLKTLKSKYEGDDRAQFRRIIRYLKKWKDVNFSTDGNSAPTGISLTVLAYDLFNVEKEIDPITYKITYDDFAALYNLVKSISSKFTYAERNEEYCYAISAKLPVKPGNDLFEKMTNKQMDSFYEKIHSLASVLEEVKNYSNRKEACTKLAKVFGDDFPVTVDKSLVGSSESA